MITKDLNLLPDNIKRERRSRERTRMVILLSLLVLLSCAGVVQAVMLKTSQLNSRKEQLAQKITELKGTEELEKNLLSEKKKLTQTQNVLQAAGKGNEELLSVFEKIEKEMPKSLFFLDVAVAKDGLTIKGAAKDDEAVADFIRRMKEIKSFEKVFVPTISGKVKNEKDGQLPQQVNFTMNCTLKVEKGN